MQTDVRVGERTAHDAAFWDSFCSILETEEAMVVRFAHLFAFASLASLVVVGCAGKSGNPTSEGLDAESAALVDDSAESDDTEADVEAGIEDPLSGASEAGEVNVSDPMVAATAGKTNPGIFFKPAGCIVSTLSGAVVTHVFTNCTGPYGLTSFNGTITSTWSKIANGVSVKHETTGFKINGATIDHTVTIDYTKVGSVYTKTRHGSSSGTTAKGRAITHKADYVTTYDASTTCIKRDGASNTTIGGREFSRSIKDYERCGVGLGGCPKDGTFTLTRAKLSLTLDFPGGAKVDITINGKKYERPLLCRA